VYDSNPSWSTSNNNSSTLVGFNTGKTNTAANNTYVGCQSGSFSTTKAANTAVGMQAGYWGCGGNDVAIGYHSLYQSSPNNQGNNTAVGVYALKSIGTSLSGGGSNIAIGYAAGFSPVALDTGTNNILIGVQAVTDNTNSTGEVVIGYQTTGNGNNTVTIGNKTTTTGSYIQNVLIQQNPQSANYTCVLADGGKQIFHPSADTTSRAFTIPANSSVAYPIGTTITFINQHGAGDITISVISDNMYLAGGGTTGTRTLLPNGIATAIKVTTTEWLISGTGLL